MHKILFRFSCSFSSVRSRKVPYLKRKQWNQFLSNLNNERHCTFYKEIFKNLQKALQASPSRHSSRDEACLTQYFSNFSLNDGFYLFISFILSLMLTITKQILFTIKNSNTMLIDVNTLVKKILLKTKHFLKKRNKIKQFY